MGSGSQEAEDPDLMYVPLPVPASSVALSRQGRGYPMTSKRRSWGSALRWQSRPPAPPKTGPPPRRQESAGGGGRGEKSDTFLLDFFSELGRGVGERKWGSPRGTQTLRQKCGGQQRQRLRVLVHSVGPVGGPR